MSSTGYTTVSRSIIDALRNCAKLTGKELSKDLPSCRETYSPDAILKLLQERETPFKEYRYGKSEIAWLTQTSSTNLVQVLNACVFWGSWQSGEPLCWKCSRTPHKETTAPIRQIHDTTSLPYKKAVFWASSRPSLMYSLSPQDLVPLFLPNNLTQPH
ncbi:hypothetical protein BC826DRAFT_629539 [Russula brevipes]|nr:hypothetical protein BC826DRAFT_629539 [Russula brevipes]